MAVHLVVALLSVNSARYIYLKKKSLQTLVLKKELEKHQKTYISGELSSNLTNAITVQMETIRISSENVLK